MHMIEQVEESLFIHRLRRCSDIPMVGLEWLFFAARRPEKVLEHRGEYTTDGRFTILRYHGHTIGMVEEVIEL